MCPASSASVTTSCKQERSTTGRDCPSPLGKEDTNPRRKGSDGDSLSLHAVQVTNSGELFYVACKLGRRPWRLSGLARRASSKMRVSFRALRYAGSKKGSLLGPCVTQEAKKGLFRRPALRRKQKKGLFRALRCAGSKKGSLSGPCVAQEAKKGHFGRTIKGVDTFGTIKPPLRGYNE